MRVIREVDEARKSQAQLQRASNVEAWREADRARKNATSDILKAISALAAASAQIGREVRETTYLPGSANSLLDTALDDLRCAHAIGEELALLGQEALSRLGASSLVDQVRIDERLVEERVAKEVNARQSEVRRTETGTTAFQEFRDRMSSDANPGCSSHRKQTGSTSYSTAASPGNSGENRANNDRAGTCTGIWG